MRPKIKELLDKLSEWQISSFLLEKDTDKTEHTPEAVDTPIESS